MSIKINEIYKTIQGESTYTGIPSVLVRFTGCNLRCLYCDTKYALEAGKEMSIKEILCKIKKLKCNLISITGGEPLAQEDVYPLCSRLIENGFRVLLETNGSIETKKLHNDVVKIVDMKCPDSGEHGKTHWKNLNYLKKEDNIKFVLSSRDDYEWAKETVKKYSLNTKCNVILSPVLKKVKPGLLAKWMLNDDVNNIRLQLQLHNLIGLD